MTTTRTRTGVVVFLTAAALTAGCGQKPGVNELYAGPVGAGGGGAGVAGTGAVGDGSGLPGATDGPGAEGPTGAGATGSADVADGGPGGSGGSASVGNGRAGGPGDTTGVTDTTIKIGVHAPVTGAAAIPQQSFERAVGVYFDYANRRGGVNGRKVQVLFEDDHFDPNAARAKCKQFAEQDKVFLIIGGAGSDQIDACARYASATGVPYLSAGVHATRPGLGSLSALRTYLALSLTYEQQVPLLSRLVRSEFRGKRVALVVADNDSLDNFYNFAKSSLKKAAGSNLVLTSRIPKNTTSEAAAIGATICRQNPQAVVWNASPSTLLNVSKSMPCRVTFLGPGLTNGLNVVTQVGCPNVEGAQFYSPFPGMDVMRQNGPFVQAYRDKNGGANPDDIGAAIYGLEKLVGAMLQATGKNLSRERFLSTAASVKAFNTGVYPSTNFTSRFGGTAMNLLRANCTKREYETKRRNERP